MREQKISIHELYQKIRLFHSTCYVSFQNNRGIEKTVYVKADEYHSEYITNIQSENPMKDIGLNYIRFAETEKICFGFYFKQMSL